MKKLKKSKPMQIIHALFFHLFRAFIAVRNFFVNTWHAAEDSLG